MWNPQDPEPTPEELEDSGLDAAAMWRILVSQSALPAMLNQARFVDEVLEHPARDPSRRWECDVERGELEFDGVGVLQAQILGTLADADESWLWAWANPSLPEDVTYAARALRDEVAQFPEPTPLGDDLTTAVGPLDAAVFGAWNADADAFYIGPNGNGGTVVMLVRHPELAAARIPYERLPLILTSLISDLDVDHAMLLEGWMAAGPTGIAFEEPSASDRALVARAEGLPAAEDGTPDPAEGTSWRFAFDEQGRIAEVRATGPGAR
ncbi:DUF6882 domain-containing protein [Patulibacter sp. SYSU D01012]|uniref:DUF6882 domain-containing protein n=1 Tax=Patulibacter sp. SYSU D01012 TaxID=2817381 RepID=UPI001B301C2B|nr:DUF6882 domain-containing protein [Patulibacter sp. SYSU D01012]